MNAAGLKVFQSSPWASTAPMPVGQASVITQTLYLDFSRSGKPLGISQLMGFSIGVLHAMILIWSDQNISGAEETTWMAYC